MFACVSNVCAFRAPDHEELPNLDRRLEIAAQKAKAAATNVVTVTISAKRLARDEAATKLRARLPEVQIDYDEIIGSPKWIAARDGFLTGPGGAGRGGSATGGKTLPAADRHREIKAFVNEHAGLFGHDATMLERAKIKRESVGKHNGLRSIVWQQEHESIEVFGAVFLAHITKEGEVVNTSSQFMSNIAIASEKGRRKPAILTEPVISARQAIASAALNLGEVISFEEIAADDQPAGAEKKQHFRANKLKRSSKARLVWLPMDEDTANLCWEIWLTPRNQAETYRVLVDAETGEVLVRHCMTVYISSASYRVFTSDSPTPLSPGYSSLGNSTQPATMSRSLQTLSALNTTASPNGWINDGINETRGNNIDAHSDTDDDDAPDLPRPQGSPNRVFDFSMNLGQPPSSYRNAGIVNLFYWCNWMHDKLWELGFDEASGNYQNNNFGRGGLGNDAINAQAQDGSGNNNANFTPTDDGEPGRIQMYLWPRPSPDRDGDLDAEIIIHEFAHGLSGRLVGGGVGISGLQAQGMGEGWSDFYALTLLSQASDSLGGNYALGAYAVLQLQDALGATFASDGDNYYFGIRRYPYSTNLSKSPLTFKDIDPTQINSHPGIPRSPLWDGSDANEVHNQGEVWCAVLWDARANLINKYGYATGNQRILQLVTDGMKLCPPNPNFLQARDAILQADVALTAGADKNELWAAFSKRGMGYFATSPSVGTTVGIMENFDPLDKIRVIPAVTPYVSGPVGGPFAFTNVVFAISNTGPGSITWQGIAEPPLELNLLTGSIAALNKQSVTVSLNPAAAADLPIGLHTRTITFVNQTSGAAVSRPFVIAVGQPNDPAEDFWASNVFNLEYTTLTFTPDATGSYAVCRQPAASFPSSTANATTLGNLYNDNTELTLSGGKQFKFFGNNYSSFRLFENGFITFSDAGAFAWPYLYNLYQHFEYPRISGLPTDYLLFNDGRLSWQQFSNRVAVTWEKAYISEIDDDGTNNFQIEMFFDDRIRITYLKCDSRHNLTGLSRGGGRPTYFRETDFAGVNTCGPSLNLSLPPNVTEGMAAQPASVSIPAPLGVNLTVSLSSSDTTEITVPASVNILAGATNATFNVTVANDALKDGSQISYITASAAGYPNGVGLIRVHDNDTATLGLTVGTPATEGGALGSGTVFVNTPVQDTVGVTLTSSNPGELLPDPLVFIPQGQTSAVFSFWAVDDNRIDGSQTASITASVSNWVSANAVFTAKDNETTNLFLRLPWVVTEGSETLTNVASVELSGTLPTNLLVAVYSSEARVVPPWFVFIPAGVTNVPFNLFIGENSTIDPSFFYIATLWTESPGFVSGTNYCFLVDNDGPPEPFNPYPPDLSENIPIQANLSWGAVEGELLVNGTFESGNLTGWTRQDKGVGGFVINNGAFDPESPDGALSPIAGSYSALSQQLGNGQHVLYQDFFIPDSATNVVLSWTDRIRNHATQFTTNQLFRVELRNPANDVVLTTLFTTTNGFSLFSGPTTRTFNLNQYRGQNMRLAFVEIDGLGHLNVHLDNVSVAAGSAAPTTFQVYFGTNSTPGGSDYQGTTANESWNLPTLAGGMNYYWQIKSIRAGATNPGPVWTFHTIGQSSVSSPIPFGSSWKYAATGGDLGTGWTNLNFSDLFWPANTGVLGYGGKQNSTIGAATNSYVTYYFRKKFNLTDLSRIVSVTGRLICDDGAIVYINGQEAVFENMPVRTAINYQTEAATAISGLAETFPITYNLSPSMLLVGENIVAVEVHQYHPVGSYSPDLYFDFQLTTLTNAGNLAPSISLTSPVNFSQMRPPTNITFTATVSDENPLQVDFFANGVKLSSDSAAPFTYTWNNPAPGDYTLTAVVYDSWALTATSAPVRVVVAPTNGTVMTLVPSGAVWFYNDTGTNDSTWYSPSYHESHWKTGPSQLGYGDGDEATVVSYGLDAMSKPITTYFRHHFTNNVAMSSLTMRMLRDDGLRVYLNGTEVLRNNLPSGTITATNLATGTVSGANENAWLTTNPSTSLVMPGDNVIAAEVHQDGPASSDLSFDLELTGVGNVLPSVSLTNPTNGSLFMEPSSLLLTATASDLYGTITNVVFYRNGTNLGSVTTAPYQIAWNNPGAGVYTLTAAATDNSGATVTSPAALITVMTTTSLMILANGNQCELSWLSPGYVLESATNLVQPVTWSPVTNAVQFINGLYRVVVTPEVATDGAYFRLRTP
jgi:hypothetical protein